MGYRSPRKLCSFAEGLLLGAADHYGEQLTIEQPRCMKRGDDQCVLEIAFADDAESPLERLRRRRRLASARATAAA